MGRMASRYLLPAIGWVVKTNFGLTNCHAVTATLSGLFNIYIKYFSYLCSLEKEIIKCLTLKINQL